MEEVKYLIIGGGIAGTTAAETIRKNDSVGKITIVSDEPYPLYSRIMLSKPNFFLEKIPLDNIILKKDSWYAENAISLIKGRKAQKLSPETKIVTLDDSSEIKFEKLLLAIGSSPKKIEIKGADKQGVFYLRSLGDANNIISAVKSSKSAVLIGGGFIGYEMCDLLRLKGVDVTLVIRESRYWEKLLDEAASKLIEDALEKGGVRILRASQAQEIIGNKNVESIILDNGNKVACDMAIIGIGVTSPLDWISEAGIAVNRGIIADEFLKTNIPDIWTAGDASEFNDLILGGKVQLGNWVNAQMQGRTAGLNMVGKNEPFKMVSFYTTQGFGISIAFVGDVRLEPSRRIVTRGSLKENSYARLIIEKDELVGATLINSSSCLAAISKMIKDNIKLKNHEGYSLFPPSS